MASGRLRPVVQILSGIRRPKVANMSPWAETAARGKAAMTLRIVPLSDALGAEVAGPDWARPLDRNTNRDADCDPDRDANRNADDHTDRNTHGHADRNPDCDADDHTDRNTNGHAHADRDPDANRHAHGDADRNADGHADCDADVQGPGCFVFGQHPMLFEHL